MAPERIEFDEATHTYRVGGAVTPSVTQVLKPLADYSHIPERRLLAKSALGTAVHRATEIDDDGLLDPERGLDEATVHPLVRPYLQAYRRWRSEMHVTVVSSEQRVYHPTLRYCGTFDVTVEIAGQRWIVDKKSTATDSPVWRVQTAAYREAMPDKAAYKPAALHLRPDGSYRWLPYDKPEHAHDFAVFLGLLNAHHWRIRNGV